MHTQKQLYVILSIVHFWRGKKCHKNENVILPSGPEARHIFSNAKSFEPSSSPYRLGDDTDRGDGTIKLNER